MEKMTVRLQLLCSLLLLGCAPGAAAPSPASACQEIEAPIETAFVSSPDLYRAANVEAGKVQAVRFGRQFDPTKGRRFVQIDPLVASALLDDGTGIQFIRDVDGDGRILNAKFVRSANCWLEAGDFSFGKPDPQLPNELILSDYPADAPRESLRIENGGGSGKVSRILRFPGKPAREDIVEPLIVTDRPIDAIGVSVPSPEGGWHSLILLMREPTGSLTIASYAFSSRSWSRRN